tara:strand:+ start:102 stop:284 length:183 start_codon:yes stop_codon:yes gene_type:complete
MKWFDIIKNRYNDRKKPSKRGRTTPSGSKQAKVEQLVDDLLSGKITEAQYKEMKEALDSE